MAASRVGNTSGRSGRSGRSAPSTLAILFGVVLVGSLVAGAALYLLRSGDSPPSERPSASLAAALAGADTTGFARVREPRPFVFPEDHGPHPGYRTEWWYFTGNLDGEDGRRFGYQLTLFRNAISPVPPAIDSEWATRQLFMGHLGITDAAGGEFHGFERFVRGAAGLAGAGIRPLRVWMEEWSIEEIAEGGSPGEGREAPNAVFPLRLRASDTGIGIDLRIDPGKPIVLQGERGYSRKGEEPGNASHYYSFTRLPTSGTFTMDGRTFVVRGESWLDREWSTSALDEGQVGWDWFALQFEDGTELMYYQLRGEDGRPDPFSRGTFVDVDGGYIGLAREGVTLEVLERWTSPLGGTYPARWRMGIPELDIDLEIEPVLADQEHDAYVRYWEGAVDVRGTRGGRSTSGRGYVELTGYADADADVDADADPDR